jgi:RNA polymerase sigma-70 factor (ECF subfamily)
VTAPLPGRSDAEARARREEEDALARRSRAGDPVALAVLYRRLAPALVDLLERTLRDRHAAEDVLHETFLRVFQGRGRYDGRGRFRAWLFTIAMRIARDRLRRRRRHERLRESVADVLPPPAAEDPATAAGRRDLLERVESVVADLPEDYAVTFHLRIREEMTYAEISNVLGDPEGTLRSRVHHVLHRVRRTLRAAESPTRVDPKRGESP